MPYEPLPSPDGRPPGHVSEGLDRVLASLGSPPVDTVTRIRKAWAELVGPDAAEVLVPVRVHDGVLVLRAVDPAWASQARWLEAGVVARARELLGEGVVERLEVRVREAPR